VLMHEAGEDGVFWVENEASKAGFEADHGIKDWLGSVIGHGGVEMSGMCWFFHQHAGGYVDKRDSL
jgi:hypothetical protein